jgi:hypothetical protein
MSGVTTIADIRCRAILIPIQDIITQIEMVLVFDSELMASAG